MERVSAERVVEFQTFTLAATGQVVEQTVHQARLWAEDLPNSVTLELAAIPGGRFLMGSPAGQGYEDEHPQHEVAVAPFWMGRYPVTQAQWEAIMGMGAPFRFRGANRPAENVSWHDAAEFCLRLSQRIGRHYALPSEAQWEYACRAGTSAPFSCGETITTDMANYVGEFVYREEPKGIYRHGTTDAGRFPPNAFGLHDMHGNLWEWCADAWHGDYRGAPADGSVWAAAGDADYRVARGGSWHDGPALCRCATRLRLAAAGDDFIGFRVACAAAG